MEYDPKLIARLLGYGRVMEEPQEYPVDFMTPASKGDAADHNQVNNMGDNPMKDPSIQEDEHDLVINQTMLSKLHHMLNGMGIMDSDIAMGDVGLETRQEAMLLKHVTGQELTDEAQIESIMAQLLDALATRLMGKDTPVAEEQLDEFKDIPMGSRFSYVADQMGNVMVYDGEAGTAVELKGDDAVQLLGAIEMAQSDEEIQEILGSLESVMEDTRPAGGQFDFHSDANKNFASQGTTAGLKSLEQDINNMRNKLKQMAQKAQASKDVEASFAAEVFNDELDRFEHALKDYLEKIA